MNLLKYSGYSSRKPNPLTEGGGKISPVSIPKSLTFDGLFSATFIITIATGLLYIPGYSYQSGYLHSWGVDVDLFILPVQQYLVYGCKVLSVNGMLGGLIWMVIIAVLLLIAYLWNRLGGSISKTKITKSSWQDIRPRRGSPETKNPDWYKKSIKELLLNFLIMLMIVLLSLSIYYFYHLGTVAGERLAKTELADLSNEKIGYSVNGFKKVKRIQTEQNSFDAFVIAASERFYALYVPKGKDRQEHLITIPTSSILSVTSEIK